MRHEILERVSDAFVALDRGWRYVYVNGKAGELFGRRPEDLVGKHIWTEFPEGIGQPFQRAYEQAMTEQVPVEFESYYAPWDRWFEQRVYPSPDGLSIFFHEVTEQRRAGAELQASRRAIAGRDAVLEAIAGGAPLASSLERLVRLIETEYPEMLGSILLLDADGVHMRHGAAPSLPAAFVAAIDGEPIGPVAGSCGTAAYRREAVIVEDIAVDPLWDAYRPLALGYGLRACWSTPIVDPGGRVLGLFAMYHPVPGAPTAAQRRLIEASTQLAALAITADRERAALRRRETQLAEAQRIAQIGSFEWDIASDTMDRSEELCRIFGRPAADMPPAFAGYLELIHPDDRARTRAAIESALRDRAPFALEERIVRPDGSIRHLHSRGTWACDAAGGPVRLIGICQDVTDRRAAEAQLRRSERDADERRLAAEALAVRNEALGAFAYTVSHDLQAPLRAIAGYGRELVERHADGASERAQWCAEQIVRATGSLERLIGELLEYSRLEAQLPAETDVDVAAVIANVLDERRPLIQDGGVEVVVEVAVPTLRTWERGLMQVLANLVDNAVKYSRRASPPRVRIAARPDGDTVRLSVADNGIGFDMQQHERLFGLFTRLVSADDFEGTGAGLAIARKLVEKMGGRLYAESTPGAGATFHVELPHTLTADPSRR